MHSLPHGATLSRHGRLDALDGMRTIAVFLVVLFHVSAPGFGAGFIGVDVFFVLSGYLITSGLLRELRAKGRISLTKFWTKRFKRLMPAAMLLIVVVLAYTLLADEFYRRARVGEDAWWTVLYLANWHFMGAGSYFSSDGAQSPLLHMWSLAVEEQFYVAWPLLLTALVVLIGVLTRNRQDAGPRAVRASRLLALVLLLVSAVLLAALFSPDNPDRAYMGTDTKVFEPLLGAFAATMLTDDRVLWWVRRYANLLTWIGTAIAVVLYFFMAGPSLFYFRGGAFVFSVAVMVAIAGAANGASNPLTAVLACSPMAYLGRISYGIYLWHWPWAIWLDAHARFGLKRSVAVVALTVASAALSYHVYEMPFRQGRLSDWLAPARTGIAALLAMAMVGGLASYAGGTPLTPAVRTILPRPLDAHQFLLVGDSVPSRMLGSLSEVARSRGLVINSASRGGCSPLGVEQKIAPDDQTGKECLQIPAIQSQALTDGPGVVVWWSRQEVADRYVDGRLLTPDDPGFWEAQLADYRAAIDRLARGGATVVMILTEPPGIGMKTRCRPGDCHPFLDRLVTRDDLRVRWNELVRAEAARDKRIRLADIDAVLCPRGVPTPTGQWGSALCDDRAGDTRWLLRPDGSHVNTRVYGPAVARQILDVLTGSLGR